MRKMWEAAAGYMPQKPQRPNIDDLIMGGPKRPNPQFPEGDIMGGPKRPMVPVSPLHSKKDMGGLPSHPVQPVPPSLTHAKTKSKPMVPPPRSPLN